MGFLKRLTQIFAGAPQLSGDAGLYYYLKCNRCGEVIRVRINPMNDLSQRDGEDGYYVRKVIVGQRCYNRIEAEFTYDNNRKLQNSDISGGTLADKAAYDADQEHAAQSTK
jgi:hypothetical protein